MKTILLIDDDTDLLVIPIEELNRAGYSVIRCSDKEWVFSTLGQGVKVDLVITHYQMSEIDALSFLFMLRKLIPKVPVIVLARHGNVDSYIKAMSLGVFEYICKPVSGIELSRLVKAALKQQQSDDYPLVRDAMVLG